MAKRIVLTIFISLLFCLNVQRIGFAQDNVLNQNNEITEPEAQKILSVSRSSLNSQTANVGEQFSAVMAENLMVGDEVIIPAKSVVYGEVIEVKKAKRFSQDALITVSVNRLQTPQGLEISLAGREILGKIVSPYKKPLRERVVERVPNTIASTATSISLDNATDLDGGVIYAIQTGAAMVTGFFAGLLDPDVGRTRLGTGIYRSVEVTPIGAARTAIQKGQKAEIDTGDGLVLNFDEETVAKIQNQYYAAIGRPTIATK